jgi:type I restriction enzyme S subunit
MRDGWKEVTIGEIADVLSGFAFKSDLFSDVHGIPLIRIRDLQKKTWTEVNYVGEFDSRYKVSSGDFLIGMDGEFRCYEWLGEDALLNQRVCRIQDFDLNVVVPRFIYFLVNQYLEKIEESTAFTTVKHISTRQIRDIRFPMPKLDAQKRIVNVMSSVDNYIVALEQQIVAVLHAKSSLLEDQLEQEFKGAKHVKLGDVLEISRGGSPRPIQSYLTDSNDGLNWIKIGDASNSTKYIYETKQKIKREGLSKTRQVFPGDFLLSNSMSFGRPYIMRTEGCIHDGWLLLGNVSKYFDEDFLYNLLRSSLIQARFSSQAAGSGVKNLNIDIVSDVEIPLPSIPDQRKIADLLNSFDAQELALEDLLSKALAMRNALLGDLLSGNHEIPKSYDSFLEAV